MIRVGCAVLVLAVQVNVSWGKSCYGVLRDLVEDPTSQELLFNTFEWYRTSAHHQLSELGVHDIHIVRDFPMNLPLRVFSLNRGHVYKTVKMSGKLGSNKCRSRYTEFHFGFYRHKEWSEEGFLSVDQCELEITIAPGVMTCSGKEELGAEVGIEQTIATQVVDMLDLGQET